jgi:hypothetical protein
MKRFIFLAVKILENHPSAKLTLPSQCLGNGGREMLKEKLKP